MIDKRMQMIADWSQRIFFHALAFWPAEMRHQNRFGIALTQIIDCRQTFADARVVRDVDLAVAFFDRHVEIDPHQHAFAAYIEIAKGKLAHKLAVIPSGARSLANARWYPNSPSAGFAESAIANRNASCHGRSLVSLGMTDYLLSSSSISTQRLL